MGHAGQHGIDPATRTQSGQLVVDPSADFLREEDCLAVKASAIRPWSHAAPVVARVVRVRLAFDVIHEVHHNVTIRPVAEFTTAVTCS
jgi:hypothetical protein